MAEISATAAGSVTPSGIMSAANAIAAGLDNPVGDIVNGAQLGFGPNLPNIDGATPLVLNPTIIIVTRAPSMFSRIPYATEILKSLVERHAREVTGIDFGYQVEGSPTPIGQDGQEIHMPTHTKRTGVQPTFNWPEINGNLVWNFIRTWILLMKDPDTQASVLAAIDPTSELSPQQYSSFTMDIACIQFDSTMRPENIIDGWFIIAMWPSDTGMFGAERQIGRSKTMDRSIPFYGVLQHNRNTKAACQRIAQALQLHTINYDFAVPVTDQVDPLLSDMGIDGAAQQAMADFTDFGSGLAFGDGAPVDTGTPSTTV